MKKSELIKFMKKVKDVMLNKISINNVVINNSLVVKTLSLYFNEFLDMQYHITKLCQNVHLVLKDTGGI